MHFLIYTLRVEKRRSSVAVTVSIGSKGRYFEMHRIEALLFLFQDLSTLHLLLSLTGRLAPVLKTIFHQCVILYTCSQSYSDGSVLKQSHQSKTGYKYMI